MDKKDTYLIVAAVVICIIICALSPYIASGDPDGLEKSAEDAGVPEDFSVEEIGGIPEAIFPDYAFANDPENQVLYFRCRHHSLRQKRSWYRACAPFRRRGRLCRLPTNL